MSCHCARIRVEVDHPRFRRERIEPFESIHGSPSVVTRCSRGASRLYQDERLQGTRQRGRTPEPCGRAPLLVYRSHDADVRGLIDRAFDRAERSQHAKDRGRIERYDRSSHGSGSGSILGWMRRGAHRSDV